MSKIEEIKPIKVLYALQDIFNALNKNIADLETAIEQERKADYDPAFSLSALGAQIGAKKEAIEKVSQWLDEGVEYVETDAVFSVSNIPAYDHSASLCTQIIGGRLKPAKLDL